MYQETDLQVGDIVKITDGSQAHRMDQYESYTSIGTYRDEFEVIYVEPIKYVVDDRDFALHDIHIKNRKTGAIYLHSSVMVRLVSSRKEQEIKKIKNEIAALEERIERIKRGDC